MATKHQYEDEINKRKVEIIESINDIPTALKEKDYIRVRILLNRSKDLLEKIVDIASIPDFKTATVIQVNVPYIERDEAGTPINKLPQKRKVKQ